ncbi:hypothetical protein IF2G_06481 [Cordyceps javanica]|nr:hypothetical protein IF2G_06481 [Cordyceps javanica]
MWPCDGTHPPTHIAVVRVGASSIEMYRCTYMARQIMDGGALDPSPPPDARGSRAETLYMTDWTRLHCPFVNVASSKRKGKKRVPAIRETTAERQTGKQKRAVSMQFCPCRHDTTTTIIIIIHH